MKIKTKKVVAREFLILVATFTISLISFFATYPYNWIKSFQINKLSNIINYKTHIADSLGISYDKKTFKSMDYISRIYAAFNEGAIEYDLPTLNSPASSMTEQEFRQKILSDTLYRKSFEQVIRYKKYLASSDSRHHYYIKKYLGRIYLNYDFTLLMGSAEEKEANKDLIDRLKNDYEFMDIKLVTYEELLAEHIELCDRLQNLNVF